jgi:hypothetical protein
MFMATRYADVYNSRLTLMGIRVRLCTFYLRVHGAQTDYAQRYPVPGVPFMRSHFLHAMTFVNGLCTCIS